MSGFTGSHNPLLVNYFEFVLDRVPNMVYFCQTVKLPGIGFGSADQPTVLGYPVKVPTGAIRFEELELSFRVDENMINWLELHNWIKTTSNYLNDINTLPYERKTSGATLFITNSVYKPKIQIQFKQVFPIYVSGIQFQVNAPTSLEALAAVKFGHTGYEITRLVNP